MEKLLLMRHDSSQSIKQYKNILNELLLVINKNRSKMSRVTETVYEESDRNRDTSLAGKD